MKPPLNLTTELVPLTYVEALLELAHTFGVEREALFAAARVKPQVLQHPNGRVSFLDFNLLAVAALQACHEPALGLLLGQRLNVSSHGILGYAVLASANLEVVSDDGYLGNPYRAARVFGATVPERNPRTRTSRALKFRVIGDLGERNAARAEYRYFWDTWAIKAHTLEAGYSRYVGSDWLADGFTRFYKQSDALFYSDNATSETTYISRNRQLSAFRSFGIGGKLSYTAKRVPGQYEMKIVGSIERIRFDYKNFTDIRTGEAYKFNANLLQLYVTATY